MNLAIIPARIGSKRIPKKNIKNFCGSPIISFAIDVAQKSGLFERIIVSTDSEEVSNISKNLGAEVPFLRSSELSDDHTPLVPVINNVINSLGGEACKHENICCIYPCAPLLLPRDLQNSLELMIESKSNSCIPVCEFDSAPQRAFMINDEGKLVWVNPQFKLTRTQDLDKMYHDTGAFAWATKGKWLQGDISDGIAYTIPNSRAIDIDTQQDWDRAELAFKMSLQKK